MPTPKEMEKLAAKASDKGASEGRAGAGMAEEYWQAILADPRAQEGADGRVTTQRLYLLAGRVLRIFCRRCDRLIEIQKADAIRLYGEDASTSDVARKLLGTVCESRTGRHEDDGCWPKVRMR